MPTPQLPGYAASPLTPTGHLSKEWYRYLKWVGERDTSAEADSDDAEYKLVGPLSIVVSGLLQNGLASVALKNDQLAPEATSYYGTDDSGTKGWHLIADALAVNASLTKDVDADTNVTTFSLADGDKGDITVSSDGTAWAIDANAVTYAKMQDVSAASKLLGRGDSGSGDPQEITLGTGLSMSGTTLSATGGAGGAMTLLGTATVAGAAATVLTLSGLDLSAYKSFFVTFALDNATASAPSISLYFNSDTTATNYYDQFLTGDAAVPSSVRSNSALIGAMSASETMTGHWHTIKDRDGKPRSIVHSNREAAANIRLQIVAHVWNSATNVTGITLASSVASALAIGSNFSVYGVA